MPDACLSPSLTPAVMPFRLVQSRRLIRRPWHTHVSPRHTGRDIAPLCAMVTQTT
jgi:hypothetical protein